LPIINDASLATFHFESEDLRLLVRWMLTDGLRPDNIVVLSFRILFDLRCSGALAAAVLATFRPYW
jgi:hypothetical protein